VAPVGILGGTFDPVHNAHLAIAARALEALGASRVLWIPTGAPHYREPAIASAADRIAMLELAIQGEPRYAIDESELAPNASGYTYDTLVALRAELGPDVPLVMLIGADQYEKLDSWHRARELFALCSFAVFGRPASAGGANAGRSRPGVIHVEMAPLATSSTAIRARIRRGEDASADLPEPVLRYIQRHHLYGHP
jgi:nicotinate-nucleotide adenylyltransferase